MKRFICAAALTLLATPLHAMELKSADVSQGAPFPQSEICSRYGGSDISPALSWSCVPTNTKSLALTIFDPDAHGGWWHWLMIDIPAGTTTMRQGAGSGKAALPADAQQLENSDGNAHYDGPCPPEGSGTPHYEITLWALPEKAVVPSGSSPADIGAWLAGHALAKAQLTPVYRK